MKKVLYEELLPEEFVQRMQEMPVAYLPLGTLEWHGPHMPLGADGIQSKELFVRVAEKVGGVVLPILFMGPDRVFHDHEKSFYGMDINTEGALHTYYVQQLKGSAYWLEKELFQDYLRSIFAQLSRAGVRIVVGHGHGPSIHAFQELTEEAEENFKKVIPLNHKTYKTNALYSLGVLCYNDGANILKKAAPLANSDADKYAAEKEKADARFKEAVDYLEEAAKISPENANVKKMLPQVKTAMK